MYRLSASTNYNLHQRYYNIVMIGHNAIIIKTVIIPFVITKCVQFEFAA